MGLWSSGGFIFGHETLVFLVVGFVRFIFFAVSDFHVAGMVSFCMGAWHGSALAGGVHRGERCFYFLVWLVGIVPLGWFIVVVVFSCFLVVLAFHVALTVMLRAGVVQVFLLRAGA